MDTAQEETAESTRRAPLLNECVRNKIDLRIEVYYNSEHEQLCAAAVLGKHTVLGWADGVSMAIRAALETMERELRGEP